MARLIYVNIQMFTRLAVQNELGRCYAEFWSKCPLLKYLTTFEVKIAHFWSRSQFYFKSGQNITSKVVTLHVYCKSMRRLLQKWRPHFTSKVVEVTSKMVSYFKRGRFLLQKWWANSRVVDYFKIRRNTYPSVRHAQLHLVWQVIYIWAADCKKAITTFAIDVVSDQPAHPRSLIRAYSVAEVALLPSA